MTALSLSSQESHHWFLVGLSRLQLALPAMARLDPLRPSVTACFRDAAAPVDA